MKNSQQYGTETWLEVILRYTVIKINSHKM